MADKTPPRKGGFGKKGAAMKPARPDSPQRPTSVRPPPSRGRKRSTAVTLLALGAGAATIYAATRDDATDYALERTEQTQLFTSKEDCASSGKVPTIECENAWREAQKAHESHAPRFSNQASCEAEFGAGKCAPPATLGATSGVFVPAMAGYALARMTNGYRAQALYQRVGDAPGQFRVSGFVEPPPPQQQQSSSSSSGSGSRSWSSRSSASSWSRSSSPTVSRTGTQSAISRGGFGSTSRSYSSSSSSRSSSWGS